MRLYQLGALKKEWIIIHESDCEKRALDQLKILPICSLEITPLQYYEKFDILKFFKNKLKKNIITYYLA